MENERKVTVIKDGIKEDLCYYIKKTVSREFGCEMYNVGIRDGEKTKEIEDFSPDFEEAVRLRDYLYERNVNEKNLFEASEEFIVTL